MKNKIHFYVNRKSVLTWLMAVCMVVSAVARMVFFGVKGSGDSAYVWSQIVLPAAATILYLLIALLDGKEHFYKTAIPVWMMALYAAFLVGGHCQSRLVAALFFIALFFFAFLYTEITAGLKGYAPMLLALVAAVPLTFLVYCYRAILLSGQVWPLVSVAPDLLFLTGVLLLVFSLKIHTGTEYHPTWGDRPDGRRIRSQPPMDRVSPYIQVTRSESSNLFSETVEISRIDRYIRQKRREGLTNFGINHVLVAAYCRGLCRYPALNRFLSGQRVYSRGEDIQYCMTIKKTMSADSPDSFFKLHLSPRDTAEDVYLKFQAAVKEIKDAKDESDFDNTAGIMNLIPGLALKFAVWLLKLLDYFGLIPRFLLEVSPFHGSLYMTNLGSLGILPVFHHLYNFGNLPIFMAFGMKRRSNEVQEDGTVVQRRYIDIRITVDERIVDGYYYAAFFKHYMRILQNPEILDHPPEEVLRDID